MVWLFLIVLLLVGFLQNAVEELAYAIQRGIENRNKGE